MRNRSWKISAALVLSCTLLALITAEAVTWLRRRAEVDPVSDQQKLARSLGIIRQSTAEHPGVLKVLFYGQSITKSGWHTAVVEHWHQRYPNTTFVVENLALGGFDSLALERTQRATWPALTPTSSSFTSTAIIGLTSGSSAPCARKPPRIFSYRPTMAT